MWNFLAAALLPGITLFVGYVMCMAAFQLWARRQKKHPRQSPLSRPLLRTPGSSLRHRIFMLDFEIVSYVTMLAGCPILAFAVHVSSSYYYQQTESILRYAVIAMLVATCSIYLGRKLIVLLQQRKDAVLGLEGELATAEELNLLLRSGCYVFHDVPYRWGNIDHVVVSRSGVFSVNTKMRGKPKIGSNKSEVVVDYDRGCLRFPNYTTPIPDLQREAKWLSAWLSSAVGRNINVEPILALPGWFIKERLGKGLCIINPLNATKYFVNSREQLSTVTVTQVAHQLEQLCRTVEPSFRENPKWVDD